MEIINTECQSPARPCQFTNEELYEFYELLRGALIMSGSIAEIEPLLRSVHHPLCGRFYSMQREFARTISRTKKLIEREAARVNPHSR